MWSWRRWIGWQLNHRRAGARRLFGEVHLMPRHVLMLLTAVLLVAADGPADANKKDLEKLQGDWGVASQVIDGRKVADDEAQTLFRTVKDDTYTVFYYDKQIGKGTFTIDATQKPKAIDARPAGAAKGSPPLLGIYEVEGDTYRVCFAPAGKERPKDFACQAGSGHTLTVWKREKK
jgi:uncharacterized protein (TIGR03067 family)